MWTRFALHRRTVDQLPGKALGLLMLLVICQCTAPQLVVAVETITFRPYPDRDDELSVTGEILVKAADGGFLLLADDGKLWTVQPERLISRSSDATRLTPITNEEASQRLLKELPPGFRIYQTANYVICHNTPDAYVQWVGSLFEQAHSGFYTYWKNKGRQLDEAEFPLVALVFADQQSFAQFARPEVGDLVDSVIGYYNLQSNRMMLYYLDNAERRVATLIHEAVHQLSYNSGLQRRMADNPYWVSEGLATYFETPDSSARGWRNIGGINMVNLERFVLYSRQRPADSLATLIRDDNRFRNPATAPAAYAEAWALNYFLLRARRKEYLKYLEALSKSPLMQSPDPRARVQAFQDAMGVDLATLDRQFIKYLTRHVRN